jgi:hypothetical protein
MGQQSYQVPISKSVAVIKYQGDMASLLAHLPETFGVTLGLEVDPQKPYSLVRVDLREATIHDVLNAIVQSEPRYRWQEVDGFIEVLPVAQGRTFLDTTISNFRVNDVDPAEAINQLMNLPEVQAGMKAMNLDRRELNSASPEKKGEKVSISLEDVTIRRALHRIMTESGGRFWVFRRQGGFFSISNSVRQVAMPDKSLSQVAP